MALECIRTSVFKPKPRFRTRNFSNRNRSLNNSNSYCIALDVVRAIREVLVINYIRPSLDEARVVNPGSYNPNPKPLNSNLEQSSGAILRDCYDQGVYLHGLRLRQRAAVL